MSNFDICYPCKVRQIFHPGYIQKFLQNNLYTKINRKNILTVYRLMPYLLNNICAEYMPIFLDIVKDVLQPIIDPSCDNSFKYAIYFNQENHDIDSYMKCDSCKLLFCKMHCKIAPFELITCKCGKKRYLCNWCVISNDIICNDCAIVDINLYITDNREFDFTEVFLY